MTENNSISAKLTFLFSQIMNGEITLQDFADDYIAVWKELQDRTKEIIKSQPHINEPLELAREQYKSGELTRIMYADKMQEILLQVEGCEVPPFSETASILDHLMVEADFFMTAPIQNLMILVQT